MASDTFYCHFCNKQVAQWCTRAGCPFDVSKKETVSPVDCHCARGLTQCDFSQACPYSSTKPEILKAALETVDHPLHYGGADNPYEAIKVIEAWGLGFNLGNAVKYVSRAGKKSNRLEDLKKARWYLNREIENAEKTI